MSLHCNFIAETLSASLKSITAMCQKASLPPCQTAKPFFAASKKLRTPRIPASNTLAMQNNSLPAKVIAETFSANHKNTTAMLQRAPLPPYQIHSAASKRLRSSSSPVSHTTTMQTNESTSKFRIAQTLSASLKSTTAMCQKAHLPPYQAFSAVSKRLRNSSSPVSHTIAMQTNEITNLSHCLQEIRSSSGPVSHTITMQTNEPTLSKHSLPV